MDKRVGTADRNHALEVLSNAFADGYLTLQEFDERSGRVVEATYRADIEHLLADLPQDPTEMAIRGLPHHRAEAELAQLRHKGKILKVTDSVTIAFMAFCIVVAILTGQNWPFILGIFGMGAGLIGGRVILGVSDAEEVFLEEIEAEELNNREERLRIALKRRKELGS